jgi:hypothetical protein
VRANNCAHQARRPRCGGVVQQHRRQAAVEHPCCCCCCCCCRKRSLCRHVLRASRPMLRS